MSSNDNFSLKADSDDFSARLNSVFDGIASLEQDHENWRSNQNSVQNERFWKPEPVEEMSSTLQPTFKRPRGFAAKRRSLPTLDYVPNYRRNPSKWTKYSLADAPELSELSNTRAALSFLEDRKRQKLEATERENNTSNASKIVFHKPAFVGNAAPTSGNNNADSGSMSKGTAPAKGKFVMPECVVGMKKTRPGPQRCKENSIRSPVEVPKKGSLASIHLDHLEDEENDAEKELSKSEKSVNEGRPSFHKFAKKTTMQLKEKPIVDAVEDDDTELRTMDTE